VYVLQKPKRIMWETPMSVPMSVTGSDRGAWAKNQPLGGFGSPNGSGVGSTLGNLLVYGISLLMLGGAVIWVIRSVRKGN
jgi:hypothetical protein